VDRAQTGTFGAGGIADGAALALAIDGSPVAIIISCSG